MSSDPDHIQLMEDVAYRLLGTPNGEPEKRNRADLRFGTHGSMSVNLLKGTWYSHEEGKGGGVIDLIMREQEFSEAREAYEWAEKEGYWFNGHATNGSGDAGSKRSTGKTPLGPIVATYDYVDENGVLLFQVVRFEPPNKPKTFRQRRPPKGDDEPKDIIDGWVWKVGGIRRVPYRLPRLIEAIGKQETVYICEGEKDCNNLHKRGLAASTNPGGASKGESKWQDELTPHFRSADVVIIADNDDAGRNHASDVAAKLTGTAKRIRLLDLPAVWPECKPKGDISDWLEGGHSADDLGAIVAQLPDFREPRAKSKVEICTNIVLWDPAPPPPVEWSISDLIAAGSLSLLVGDSGLLKSFILWNMTIARMFGEPFAGHKVSKRSGVLILLGEGMADYRQRCRAAVKAAGHDCNERLPLVFPEAPLLPLTDKRAEEQLHGIIENANALLREQFGLDLGLIGIDTFAQVAVFQDAYKPNEIIAVNQMLRRVACSKKIDVVATEHFPKKDKDHPAGTLNKRNDTDQMFIVQNWRMTLDKSRYGPDKIWNAYHGIPMDDGAGYLTRAIRFGPPQMPHREMDNAQIFMSALENAQQDFGERIKESDLQKTFSDIHIATQKECNIKSNNPKEAARSAYRRQLDAAVKCGMVGVKDGYVWKIDDEIGT